MKTKKPRKLSWYQRLIRRLQTAPCDVHTMTTRQLRRLALMHHVRVQRMQRKQPKLQEAREREARRYRESREALGLPVK
jgi:hypothetical protein